MLYFTSNCVAVHPNGVVTRRRRRRRRTCARYVDFNRLRALLLAIRENPQHIFLPRLRDDLPVKCIAVCDAGGGETVLPPLKQRDQQCVMMLIAEGVPLGKPSKAAIVYFASNGISRVCHSSFDMEAVTGVSALDTSLNLRLCAGEGISGKSPDFREKEKRESWTACLPNLELHSDAMSFVRVVRSGTTHVLSRRRASDVEDMRQCLDRRELSSILHIKGPSNPTDIGTKNLSKCSGAAVTLDQIMLHGTYSPDAENLTALQEQINTILQKLSEK